MKIELPNGGGSYETEKGVIKNRMGKKELKDLETLGRRLRQNTAKAQLNLKDRDITATRMLELNRRIENNRKDIEKMDRAIHDLTQELLANAWN